jgi:hypothetical protein
MLFVAYFGSRTCSAESLYSFITKTFGDYVHDYQIVIRTLWSLSNQLREALGNIRLDSPDLKVSNQRKES